MKILKLGLLICFSLIVLGCQTTRENHTNSTSSTVVKFGGEFTGTSNSSDALKRDTLGMIVSMVSLKGCNTVERVDTKIIFYKPSGRSKNHRWGREEWIAMGCSKKFPFFVTFTGDGRGGTFINVE